MAKYQEQQRTWAIGLIEINHSLFEGAEAGMKFLGSERAFVLKQAEKNLYPGIRNEVGQYFRGNHISWWGGKKSTGHILSSQISCVNHLFAIRNDKAAVTAILKNLFPDFVEPIVINSDKFLPAYIQFESVSDGQYLNEGGLTRGTQCTSIDALIYAKHKDGSLWIVPIEWKYTEHYNNQNKAMEGFRANPIGCKGVVRTKRYTKLIESSTQLKSENQGCYYFEPFYQLMRQTLWAEQMVKHKSAERVKADNFLHVHVIPDNNWDLLQKKYKYSGSNMETTWRSLLKNQSQYKIISPSDLLSPISNIIGYRDLMQYLDIRYWH